MPGLYAAGEVAGNVHGANRTSGNALAETQVFGARAGHYAGEYAQGASRPEIDGGQVEREMARLLGFFAERPSAIRPVEVRKRLKRMMQEHMAHRRDEAGMKEALAGVRRLREEELPRVQAAFTPPYALEWQDALEVANMLDVAEAVVSAALLREESRGHHFRTDYPEPLDEWLQHTIVRMSGDGELTLDTAPVVRLEVRADATVA